LPRGEAVNWPVAASFPQAIRLWENRYRHGEAPLLPETFGVAVRPCVTVEARSGRGLPGNSARRATAKVSMNGAKKSCLNADPP